MVSTRTSNLKRQDKRGSGFSSLIHPSSSSAQPRPALPKSPSVRLHPTQHQHQHQHQQRDRNGEGDPATQNQLRRSLFATRPIRPKQPPPPPRTNMVQTTTALPPAPLDLPLQPLPPAKTKGKSSRPEHKIFDMFHRSPTSPPTQPSASSPAPTFSTDAPTYNVAEEPTPDSGGGFLAKTKALARTLKIRLGGAGALSSWSDLDKEASARERYDRAVIDLLDVIDPEVSTLSTLSDLQNSLFVPDLGRLVPRAPYLRLTKPERDDLGMDEAEKISALAASKNTKTRQKRLEREAELEGKNAQPDEANEAVHQSHEGPNEHKRNADLEDDRSVVARGEYLVMPAGLVEDWEEWSEEEREELDDYVRHLLHSRKWKVRRSWRGFRRYVSTPLGFFITLYATLLTFWGAAWVLFLIGWINAGNRQDYFVEICDQILTALFCTVGIGLAPFRTVDTYHMIFIARYHRKALRIYAEKGHAPLHDENDLPQPTRAKTVHTTDPAKTSSSNVDLEAAVARHEEDMRPPVLTVQEQATLIYHQTRFSKSHTFYRPHETSTHRAFPLDLLIVVVCLLDCHSLFQIALGSATWSISYHEPWKKYLTTIVLSLSISCNITAGLVIMMGNRRSRKTEVVEERLRKGVTEEAVRIKEAEREERMREEGEWEEVESPVGGGEGMSGNGWTGGDTQLPPTQKKRLGTKIASPLGSLKNVASPKSASSPKFSSPLSK